MVKLLGKLKSIKPKSRDDFYGGCICSWKNSGDSNSTLKLKNSNVLASINKTKDLGIQNTHEFKPLKVYSRGRLGRIPNIDLKKERKRVDMDGEIEDLNLAIYGDKHLLIRPDASSNSSSSNSEEVYVSDSAIERDLDEQLEGISTLLGNSEPMLDSNQNQIDQHFSGDQT